MEKALIVLLLVSLFLSCNQKAENKTVEKSTSILKYDESQEKTNDFYDDAEPFVLDGPRIIEVRGEISNPDQTYIEELPMHSVIVKEALLAGDSNKFIGAYQYCGYSLYDILNKYKLEKRNKEIFNPIIDLYIIVENGEGDRAVLSWGEIYYPVNRNNIIIATKVNRIVPSKTKELWPLPENTKLVVAHDLLTERNILNPNKITIVSDDIELVVTKGLKPLYAPDISVYNDTVKIRTITTIPEGLTEMNYETIFYGRGRGIHSTTPFNGYLLKEILKEHFALTKENIINGLLVISAPDGYRGVFTYSELFNRNDQSEILLVTDPGNKDGGDFRLFPSCDFFSDRAIKAVNGIYYKLATRNP